MIYICYGVTKSASTFLYQLTEEVLTAAHRKPARLGPPFRPHLSLDNYIDMISPEILSGVAAQAGQRDIVLKTHEALHPGIAEMIETGEILASASIRDPCEIALSMLDHAKRSRRWGYMEFSEYVDIADTLSSLDEQIARFSKWSVPRRVNVFTYNEICFDTVSVIERVAQQIGVSAEPDDVLRRFRDNKGIGQFNKGAALRYLELTPEQRAVFLDRYAELYGRFAFDTPAARLVADRQKNKRLRARGQLRQYLIQLQRHFLG